jgi:hypothetical protein
MTKTVMYVYLGTNGTITSPVHLEDTYYIRKIQLRAHEDKLLTKDGKQFFVEVLVPEAEVNEWYEV